MTILPHAKPGRHSDREVDRRSGFYDFADDVPAYSPPTPRPGRRPTAPTKRRRGVGGRRPRGPWDVLGQ